MRVFVFCVLSYPTFRQHIAVSLGIEHPYYQGRLLRRVALLCKRWCARSVAVQPHRKPLYVCLGSYLLPRRGLVTALSDRVSRSAWLWHLAGQSVGKAWQALRKRTGVRMRLRAAVKGYITEATNHDHRLS